MLFLAETRRTTNRFIVVCGRMCYRSACGWAIDRETAPAPPARPQLRVCARGRRRFRRVCRGSGAAVTVLTRGCAHACASHTHEHCPSGRPPADLRTRHGFVTQISQYSVNTNLNTTPNSQVNWDNGNSPTKKHQWDTRGFFLYHNLSNNVFLNLLGHQPKFKAINLERTRYTAGAGVQGQASRDDWAEHRARPQPCSWASGSSFSGAALPGRRRFPP